MLKSRRMYILSLLCALPVQVICSRDINTVNRVFLRNVIGRNKNMHCSIKVARRIALLYVVYKAGFFVAKKIVRKHPFEIYNLDSAMTEKQKSNPVVIYVHGAGPGEGSDREVENICAIFGDNYRVVWFAFGDRSSGRERFYLHGACAQSDDIKRLKMTIDSVCRCTDKGVILYGFSRGASTILTTLATYPGICKHDGCVRSIILEEPFSSINDIFNDIAKEIGISSYLGKIFIRQIAYWFIQNSNSYWALAPKDAVAKLPQDLPVLLFNSANNVYCEKINALFNKRSMNRFEYYRHANYFHGVWHHDAENMGKIWTNFWSKYAGGNL
jgi:pimeloyl-ACP methyl ester carboxylesterase